MRIAYITAGAAGMFCGSCLHDNTLVTALIALGHDALLVPTYTPIRTDEVDVSATSRVFFGGINVYLQQKSALFRHTPWFLDRLLDGRRLLNWVSRFAVKTQAEELGELTLSMLRGEDGFQKKELDKLAGWLADEVKPEIVNFTNVLLSGLVEPLRQRLGVPVLATLQGDDVFLEMLPDRFRRPAIEAIGRNARHLDGFVSTSRYYADFMAGYLGLPRERIDVVYPGLNLKGHGQPRAGHDGPFRIGYFARICPEKGLHVLVEAYKLLRRTPGTPSCRLHVSGWLGENQRPFFEQQKESLRQAGLEGELIHTEAPDLASKLRFFQGIDVLSVPTTYREPKGLYILEALANEVPVVQPRHGSFPELVEATGGGLLVDSDDPAALARGLRQLLDDPAQRADLARRGKEAVGKRFNAQAMAEATLDVYRKYLP